MRLPRGFACWMLAAGAFVALGQLALASETVYDGFNHSFPVYAAGGAGFSAPWVQGGFNAFSSDYSYERHSLCYPDLQRSGGSVSGQAESEINGMIRNLEQTLGADGTTVYVSFLLEPRGKLNDGVFDGFFGVTLNGSLGNDLFIGKPGGGATGQYVLETRGGFGQVPSGTATVVGRAVLLVVKAQFRPGNDLFTLYVDPKAGGSEPATSVVKADLDLGTVDHIGVYSTGAFAVDEIRIGTAFTDVVPAWSGIDPRNDRFDGCGEDDRSHGDDDHSHDGHGH
ncbi:MAG TPA: hypothetical protein VL099_11935 [Candidatus Binatia bacterium]|nr:hypothetical protein [Candidatus Binatia bacterium]